VIHRRFAASVAALLLAFALLLLFGGWLMGTFSAVLIFIALNVAAFHTVPWPYAAIEPNDIYAAGKIQPRYCVAW
jgi:hypothetical protein